MNVVTFINNTLFNCWPMIDTFAFDFSEQEIDGSIFITLQDDDFQKLGAQKFGTVIKLRNIFKNIKESTDFEVNIFTLIIYLLYRMNYLFIININYHKLIVFNI